VWHTGSLRIADSADEKRDCAAQLEAMLEDSLPVETHEGPYGAGLRFPTDLSFNPLGRCRALADSAVRRGARLYENSEAIEIHADRVRTERGHVRAGRVIVAVDGRLDGVLPELSDRVRTARLQMLGTEPARDVTLEAPMYLRFGYEYAQQLPDRSIALGGFRDRFEDAEWTMSAEPTDALQGLLTDFLRSRIGTDAKIAHRWAASVGYTDSVLPVFQEVRGGVIAIGGYNGTGNLIGALCGRAAANLALHKPHELIDLLSGPEAG
jgi:glycine/D-amino acid oxidase-like deaminating enzyme